MALSPPLAQRFASAAPLGPGEALALGLVLAASLVACRPTETDPRRRRLTWLAALTAAAGCAGLVAGVARVAALDAGAFHGRPGAAVELRGYLTAVPRRDGGETALPVETAAGRALVLTSDTVPDLRVGAEVAAAGVVRRPEPWLAPRLRIAGIETTVEAGRVRLTGHARGGLLGALDEIRGRAESALERGMPDPQAALARGFVLGQDDRLGAATEDDFRRSGLAHLLAVSGQNVLLLSALAAAVLAALGVSLRARLLWILLLIAIYVPVAGAGPSIQRAGVMGAAGLAATLLSRPRSRWYAVLLAALVTLMLNPRASADVGWQLSFAAVAGIALWAPGLARRARRRLGGGRRAGGPDWRRALAEGFGVTTAATLATAPLIAHHFDSVPLASLPANLLALPAVAPVMWLGMLAAAAGQLAALPVEALNAPAALLVAYIEQVARWFGGTGWSLLAVPTLGWPAVLGAYATMLAAGALVGRASARRRGLSAASPRALAVAALVLALAALLAAPPWAGDDGAEAPEATEGDGALEVSFLDVGQGDAILVEPPDAEPILFDGGPPGADLAAELDREGAPSLGAAVLTHDQSDHAAGLTDVLGERDIGALLHPGGPSEARSAAHAAGVPVRALSAGDRLRLGGVRLDVLWPPGGAADPGEGDPNAGSLVVRLGWRRFSLLLTGDAEAELAPVAPGVVDVLKVAHHGSEDPGLRGLLETARPRLAVISVGAENPFGHPAPETLAALDEAGASVLRTDLDGGIELQVTAKGWSARRE